MVGLNDKKTVSASNRQPNIDVIIKMFTAIKVSRKNTGNFAALLALSIKKLAAKALLQIAII